MSNDASPTAIWCFSLRSKWCCSRWSQWCDVCPMCRQAHIIRRSRHHWARPNIICRRQTSFKKRTFVLVDKSAFFVGGERGIRSWFLPDVSDFVFCYVGQKSSVTVHKTTHWGVLFTAFESIYYILHHKTKKTPQGRLSFYGGERGIRTLGTVLAFTRFPVVRLRPAQPSLRTAQHWYNSTNAIVCQVIFEKVLIFLNQYAIIIRSLERWLSWSKAHDWKSCER